MRDILCLHLIIHYPAEGNLLVRVTTGNSPNQQGTPLCCAAPAQHSVLPSYLTNQGSARQESACRAVPHSIASALDSSSGILLFSNLMKQASASHLVPIGRAVTEHCTIKQGLSTTNFLTTGMGNSRCTTEQQEALN